MSAFQEQMIKSILETDASLRAHNQRVTGYFTPTFFAVLKRNNELVELQPSNGEEVTGYIIETDHNYIIIGDHFDDDKRTWGKMFALNHIVSFSVLEIEPEKLTRIIGFVQEQERKQNDK